jgi:hypothetical protein
MHLLLKGKLSGVTEPHRETERRACRYSFESSPNLCLETGKDAAFLIEVRVALFGELLISKIRNQIAAWIRQEAGPLVMKDSKQVRE